MRCSTYGGELGTRTQTRRARPVGNPVNMTMRDIQRLQYSLLFVTTAVTPRPAAAPRVLTTRYDRLHPEASFHLDGERTTDPPFKVYLASIPLPLPSTGLQLVSRCSSEPPQGYIVRSGVSAETGDGPAVRAAADRGTSTMGATCSTRARTGLDPEARTSSTDSCELGPRGSSATAGVWTPGRDIHLQADVTAFRFAVCAGVQYADRVSPRTITPCTNNCCGHM